MTELLRVLAYPKPALVPAEQEELLGDYLPWCEVVAEAAATALPRCRDPFDQPFVDLFVAGQADFLVTGDGDLLALAEELGQRVLRATDFLAALACR